MTKSRIDKAFWELAAIPLSQAVVIDEVSALAPNPVDGFIADLWHKHPTQKIIGPFSAPTQRLWRGIDHVLGARLHLRGAAQVASRPMYRKAFNYFGAQVLAPEIYPRMAQEIAWHRANLHPLVFVSSGFRVFEDPYLQAVMPEHVLINEAFDPRPVRLDTKEKLVQGVLAEKAYTPHTYYGAFPDNRKKKTAIDWKVVHDVIPGDFSSGAGQEGTWERPLFTGRVSRPFFKSGAVSMYADTVLRGGSVGGEAALSARQLAMALRIRFYRYWEGQFAKNEHALTYWKNIDPENLLLHFPNLKKIVGEALAVAGLYLGESPLVQRAIESTLGPKFGKICYNIYTTLLKTYPKMVSPLQAYLTDWSHFARQGEPQIINRRFDQDLLPSFFNVDDFQRMMTAHDGKLQVEVGRVKKYLDESTNAWEWVIRSTVVDNEAGPVGKHEMRFVEDRAKPGFYINTLNKLDFDRPGSTAVELFSQSLRYLKMTGAVSKSYARIPDIESLVWNFGGYRLTRVYRNKLDLLLLSMKKMAPLLKLIRDISQQTTRDIAKWETETPNPGLLEYASMTYGTADHDFLMEKTRHVGELALYYLMSRPRYNRQYNLEASMNLQSDDYEDFLDSMMEFGRDARVSVAAPLVEPLTMLPHRLVKPAVPGTVSEIVKPDAIEVSPLDVVEPAHLAPASGSGASGDRVMDVTNDPDFAMTEVGVGSTLARLAPWWVGGSPATALFNSPMGVFAGSR